MKVTLIPAVIGAQVTIPKGVELKGEIEAIQITALNIKNYKLLRRVLEIWGVFLSLRTSLVLFDS